MAECEQFFSGMICRRQTGDLSNPPCEGSSFPAYPSVGWMEKGGQYFELDRQDIAYNQSDAWNKYCSKKQCQPPGNKLVICDCDHPGKGQVWNSKDCRFDYGDLYEGQYHCIQNCPSVPAIPDLPTCPKGDSYPAGSIIAFTRDCGSGYDAVGGLLNTKCVCKNLTAQEYFDESPKEVQEFYKTPEELKKGASIIPDLGAPEWFGSFGELMKVLPYLIGVLVVVQIIGAFRK